MWTSNHALASSLLVRLNIFEIARYNNNHALNLSTCEIWLLKLCEGSFFLGDWPGSFWLDLTKYLWLKVCSNLLFIVATYQKFSHMCYMGYLKQIKYFLAEDLTTPRCLWSDFVTLKYSGNKVSSMLNRLLKPIFVPILPHPRCDTYHSLSVWQKYFQQQC